MSLGENTISFDCDFVQPDDVYRNIKNAWKFEGERNKLNYDMEIESIYLIGDFSVRTDGMWNNISDNALLYKGEFIIDKPLEIIKLSNIEQQGYPFFCGEMILDGNIEIYDNNSALCLDIKGINVIEAEIDGVSKTLLTDNIIPLIGYEAGKHKIKLTLKNNLRNLLGPHHHKDGERTVVGPSEFYKEKCVWRKSDADTWNDEYCFVETGIK